MKLSFVSLFLFLSLSASAQTMLRRAPSTPAPETLGPGDQISVHIADVDDLPSTPIRIDSSGFIDLPLVGPVHASDLTVEQLREELTTKYSKFVTSPAVAINVAVTESRPIVVLGEVNQPGTHQLVGSERLLDLLAQSGGLKPDAGNAVLVTRQAKWGSIQVPHSSVDPSSGATTADIPIDSLTSLKSPADNIVMRPGDTVSVPRAELVYVVGDVHKAGGFMITGHSNMSLLHAVTLAEGLAPDNAAHNAVILRPAPGDDGQMRQIPVDVPKIFTGKAPDVQLQANDVLFIPHSGFKVGSRRALEAAIGVATGVLIYR